MTTLIEMMELSQSLDNTQEYFMKLAANRNGEVTFTVKADAPYVTVFLGKGPDAPIGMGNSFAAAMANAIGISDPIEHMKKRIMESLDDYQQTK